MKKFILFISKLLVLGNAKPLKLGLSVAFGILIAFQPINPLSLTTVILFLLLIILNLNIRLTLVSCGAGMLLALLAEPLMVLIGSFILEDITFLHPLWTTLRNIPLVPLTRFYNTTVAGGFVLAMLLFIPITLLFSFLFSKMIKGLDKKEKGENEKKEEKGEKKGKEKKDKIEKAGVPKPVKIINLTLILSVPVLVLILNYVFLPKFIKDNIEKYGSEAVGAKVELERVNINFLKATLFFYGLQVTNPDNTKKNIVAADDIKFKMNVPALLEAKAVVEIIEVKNMLFNTDRKTDGALAKKKSSDKNETGKEDRPKDEGSQILNQDFLESLENFDVSSFLQENVKTTGKILALKDKSLEDMEKWKKEIESFNYHNDLKKIYDDTAGLNINTGSFSIEDIQKIEKLISSINSSQKKVKTIVTDFNNKQKNLRRDIQDAGGSLGDIGNSARDEFNELLKKMNIKNIDVGALSQLVFSDQINSYIQKGYYWLYKVRSFIPDKKGSIKEEKKKRKKTGRSFGSLGYDVYFPVKNAKPDFLIQKIIITVDEQNRSPGFPGITGEVSNITSEQDIVGSPIKADINLTLPGAGDVSTGIKMTFDRRNNKKIDTYQVTIRDYELKQISLMGSGGLPSKIKRALLHGDSEIKVSTNRDISSTMSLNLTNMDFEFPEESPQGQFAAIIKEIFSTIDSLEFIIGVERKGEQSTLSIASNLDTLLRDKLSALFTEKVKELQEKLETEFYNIINTKKAEALALLKAKEKEALGLLTGKEKSFLQERSKVENLLKKQVSQLESKKSELNNLIEKQKQEAEDKLKEELSDQLENIPSPF